MTARNVTYSGASPIYGGMSAPGGGGGTTPAWLAGKQVNEWVPVPGTAGAGGQVLNAWCDFALVPDTGEVLILLAGGHDDGYSTAVVSTTLTQDQPSWRTRRPSVALNQVNYSQSVGGAPPPNAVSSPGEAHPYCKDGVTPSSRHTRYQSHYCTQNNRVVMISSPSLFGYGGSQSPKSNAFDLATDTWDAPGTWPDAPLAGAYGAAIDDLGNIWCRSHKFTLATKTFAPLGSGGFSNSAAFDTKRRQLYILHFGDGQGFSLNAGLSSRTVNENLGTVRVITFNPSETFTEFSSLILDHSAMLYDPVRDRFLFYYGKGISRGVIYVITPNDSTVWDMSKLPITGASLPPLPPSAGTNGRFKYLPALDGAVLMPSQASEVYFIKLG